MLQHGDVIGGSLIFESLIVGTFSYLFYNIFLVAFNGL